MVWQPCEEKENFEFKPVKLNSKIDLLPHLKLGGEYVYIYIYVSLNNKDKFCLYNSFKILSSFLLSVLVSGWNWYMNFPIFPYTGKQPLMMAYKGPKSAQDYFGKFIYQFQPETKTLIRKLERVLNELHRQNLPLLFNETWLNERLLPNHTHIHTYIYIYILILILIFWGKI